ncbi:MAG: sigma 54-interacting transcriptional regulator [Candidatus Eremiobacterota bacterium]
MKEETWIPFFIRDKNNCFLFKWNDKWETYNLTGGCQNKEDKKDIKKTIERKMEEELGISKEEYTFKMISDKFRFIQYSLEEEENQYFICHPCHIVFLKRWEDIKDRIEKNTALKWFSIEELSKAELSRGKKKTEHGTEIDVNKLKVQSNNSSVDVASALLDIMWHITKEEEFQNNRELISKGLSKIEESFNNILAGLRERNIYIGISHKAFELLDKLKHAIEDPFERPIFLTGEAGTGKSTMAKAIHELSRRTGEIFDSTTLSGISDENFQCAVFGHTKDAFTGAITDKDGLFTRCNGGTAFLDEVTTLKPSAQEILLSTLGISFFEGFTELKFYRYGSPSSEPLTSNVRIISATNQKSVYENQEIRFEDFRDDLTARLAGHIIEMPSLQDIKEDLDYIIHSFLKDLESSNKYRDKFLHLLGFDTTDHNIRKNIENIKITFILTDEAKEEITGDKYLLKGNFRSLIKILADASYNALKNKEIDDIRHIEIEIKKEHLP